MFWRALAEEPELSAKQAKKMLRLWFVPKDGGKTGDLIRFRDITGGSSRGSQNAMSVRFGLGQWTGAEWVTVLWPDGRQIVVTGVEGNQVLQMPAQ